MILLDTNALLWAYQGASELGPVSRDLITTSGPVVYSAISVVEIEMKALLGRIEVPAGLVDELTASGFEAVTFPPDAASVLRSYPHLARHDPFDRMILAHAQVSNATLLTSDRTLLGLGFKWVRDARA